MVSGTRSRRGASKFGCLLSLVLFGGAIVYGVQLGRIYYRYYALVDEMRSSARFAGNQSDEVIRRNIQVAVDELGIPPEAKRVGVRRIGPPWTIRIRTEYREYLSLPMGRRIEIPFRPTVEARF